MNEIFKNIIILLIILISHFLLNTFLLEKSHIIQQKKIIEEDNVEEIRELQKQKDKLKQLKKHINEINSQDFSIQDMKSDLLNHINNNDGITKVIMDNEVNNSSYVNFQERQYNNIAEFDSGNNYLDQFFKEVPNIENKYDYTIQTKPNSNQSHLSKANNSCLNGGTFFDNVYANDNLGDSIFATL